MHQILFICSLFREFMKILLSSIYPYAFAALFLILPFDEYVRALPNILMILLVVAFPYVIEKEDFSRIKRAVDLTPDRDNSAKIADLKARIQSGTYETNYDAIADKLLASEY